MFLVSGTESLVASAPRFSLEDLQQEIAAILQADSSADLTELKSLQWKTSRPAGTQLELDEGIGHDVSVCQQPSNHIQQEQLLYLN